MKKQNKNDIWYRFVICCELPTMKSVVKRINKYDGTFWGKRYENEFEAKYYALQMNSQSEISKLIKANRKLAKRLNIK